MKAAPLSARVVGGVGNRDLAGEEAYLRARHRRMPCTMLRYAIEKFPEPLRRRYL